MMFVLRPPVGSPDRSRGEVLEVGQVWGQTVVDTRHYAAGGPSVTVGSAYGTRLRFFERPIAWVPRWMGKLDWLAGAALAEIDVEWKSEFYVPADGLPSEEFPLFQWKGNAVVANVSDRWTGFVDQGETRTSLDALIATGAATPKGGGLYEIPLDDDTRLVVDLGSSIFYGQRVARGKSIPSRLGERLDYPLLAVLAFMGFVSMVFGVTLLTAPPVTDGNLGELPPEVVAVLLTTPPDAPKPDQKVSANPDAGEGAKPKDDPGEIGKVNAKPKQTKGNQVEIKRQELDVEVVTSAGVLGALREGASDDVFGNTGLSTELTGAVGTLLGATGTQAGTGGYGARGGGLGGDGTAEGLDRFGGLGTRGRGGGKHGYGSGGGEFGEKGEGGPPRPGGEPIIRGALDKALIDAVIRQNMNQIRYCYQRELTKNPSLAGKITESFVINKVGQVSTAKTKASTMGNSAVEDCINDRFMKFQFPEPKGGGIVIVSYPFLFAPG